MADASSNCVNHGALAIHGTEDPVYLLILWTISAAHHPSLYPLE